MTSIAMLVVTALADSDWMPNGEDSGEPLIWINPSVWKVLLAITVAYWAVYWFRRGLGKLTTAGSKTQKGEVQPQERRNLS